MSAQLQGKVSLQQRIDTPEFWALDPAEKKYVLDSLEPDFKSLDDSEKDYVLQGLQKTPEGKTAFNKKYNTGSVIENFDQLPIFDASPGKPDKLSSYWNAANMAAGSLLAPANDLINPFWRNSQTYYRQTYQNAYPGIETDPGFLGDAYRLHENHYVNMAGQLGVSYLGVGQLIKNSTGQALGRIPGLSRLGADSLRNMSAIGKFSGLTNAADVIHGKQNLLQGLANTGMDVITAPIGGKSRIGNAAIEGTTGYVSGFTESLLNDITNGQKPNFQIAQSEAKKQAAIGIGMGLALGGGNSKKALEVQAPKAIPAQGRIIKQYKPLSQTLKASLKQYGPVDRVLRGNPEQIVNRAIENATTQIINLRRSGGNAQAKQLFNALPPGMQKAVIARIEAFNAKNQGRQAINAQRIQQAAERLGPDAQNKKALAELKAAIQERYQVTPEQKTQARVQAQKQIAQNRADAQAKPIEARVKLEQARQATLQARSTREKARLEYQSAKQLLDVVKKGGDAKALANARKLVTKAQEKLTQANTVLKESKANEQVRSQQTRQKTGQEGQGKQPEGQDAGQKSPSQTPQKGQVRITGPGRNQRVIEQAIKEGKAIEGTHYADKAGTRSDSTFERKFDLPYKTGTVKRLVDPNTKRVIIDPETQKHISIYSSNADKALKSGDVKIQGTGVNARLVQKDGTILMTKDGKKPIKVYTDKAIEAFQNTGAEIKDVPIVKVFNENGYPTIRHLEDIKGAIKISDREHPFAIVMDENGNPQAIQNGEAAKQYQGTLTRHSDLKAQIEQMRALVNDPQNASVREILEASQKMKKKDFMETWKDLPQEKLDALGKENGC